MCIAYFQQQGNSRCFTRLWEQKIVKFGLDHSTLHITTHGASFVKSFCLFVNISKAYKDSFEFRIKKITRI